MRTKIGLTKSLLAATQWEWSLVGANLLTFTLQIYSWHATQHCRDRIYHYGLLINIEINWVGGWSGTGPESWRVQWTPLVNNILQMRKTNNALGTGLCAGIWSGQIPDENTRHHSQAGSVADRSPPSPAELHSKYCHHLVLFSWLIVWGRFVQFKSPTSDSLDNHVMIPGTAPSVMPDLGSVFMRLQTCQHRESDIRTFSLALDWTDVDLSVFDVVVKWQLVKWHL